MANLGTVKRKLGFKDVLIVPRVSKLYSRKEICLERTFRFGNESITCVPIVAANMDTIGTFAMAGELAKYKMLTCLRKDYDLNAWKYYWKYFSPEHQQFLIPTIGMSDAELQRLKDIRAAGMKTKIVCVDVANGYMRVFHEFIGKVRKELGEHVGIIAGNVVTREGVNCLAYNGANFAKIGIGPGSVCTTRFKTGVGYPQLSAVYECSQEEATLYNPYIIADGGCSSPGDIAKAFVAGADMVMLGGMFAGHDECAGKIVDADGKRYKKFYGMSSNEALGKYNDGKLGYRTAEGKEVLVPYRGPVKETIEDILGGIRSTGTYIGAKNIEEFGNGDFIEVDEQTNNIYGLPNL